MKDEDEKTYQEMAEQLSKENMQYFVRIRSLEKQLSAKISELNTMTVGFNQLGMRNNQTSHMLEIWRNAYFELKAGMSVSIDPEKEEASGNNLSV